MKGLHVRNKNTYVLEQNKGQIHADIYIIEIIHKSPYCWKRVSIFHYNFARIQFLLTYMCTGLGNEVSISPERIIMSVSKDGVQSIKW